MTPGSNVSKVQTIPALTRCTIIKRIGQPEGSMARCLAIGETILAPQSSVLFLVFEKLPDLSVRVIPVDGTA